MDSAFGCRSDFNLQLILEVQNLYLADLLLAVDNFRARGCRSYSERIEDMSPYTSAIQLKLYEAAFTQARLEALCQKKPTVNWETFIADTPAHMRVSPDWEKRKLIWDP